MAVAGSSKLVETSTCLNNVHDRYVLCYYSTYLSCTPFRHVCTLAIMEKYRHHLESCIPEPGRYVLIWELRPSG